ncbi:hypothetical protein GWK47_008957 [Chionoecetes opilio]|uniref:Uncharacterized protein n=1 Tax=Chionoecetes opilio TaxID=41210 RepID=A0A8J5CR37_CHIOP|nr:hypothetical protein GWK47_008957 [Chionoecetes opilio]
MHVEQTPSAPAAYASFLKNVAHFRELNSLPEPLHFGSDITVDALSSDQEACAEKPQGTHKGPKSWQTRSIHQTVNHPFPLYIGLKVTHDKVQTDGPTKMYELGISEGGKAPQLPTGFTNVPAVALPKASVAFAQGPRDITAVHGYLKKHATRKEMAGTRQSALGQRRCDQGGLYSLVRPTMPRCKTVLLKK